MIADTFLQKHALFVAVKEEEVIDITKGITTEDQEVKKLKVSPGTVLQLLAGNHRMHACEDSLAEQRTAMIPQFKGIASLQKKITDRKTSKTSTTSTPSQQAEDADLARLEAALKPDVADYDRSRFWRVVLYKSQVGDRYFQNN